MNEIISIQKESTIRTTVGSLPSSKSLSNRAIIINALTGNRGSLENLSPARDTLLMKSLISTPDHVINVMDAGTTMRFLTAYFALTNQHKQITGSARMKERPIFPLVDALRTVGASINYLQKDGYPPIEIQGFRKQLTDTISIRADISSQFISALMMTAPGLPSGLTLRLEGKTGSLPYIEMTAGLMGMFGIGVKVEPGKVVVPHSQYTPAFYRVEPDWSAASYWFAFVSLAGQAEVLLPGVKAKAVQGDKVIVDIMAQLGVRSTFSDDGLHLTKGPVHGKEFKWDFTECPDLAQTVLPVCSARGIRGEFTGLESLRIKETDRIAALQFELAKIGASLTEGSGTWTLLPGPLPTSPPVFKTYHDHRMAMGLAPLATMMDIAIEDPGVVSKSYPSFWDDMLAAGFNIRPAKN